MILWGNSGMPNPEGISRSGPYGILIIADSNDVAQYGLKNRSFMDLDHLDAVEQQFCFVRYICGLGNICLSVFPMLFNAKHSLNHTGLVFVAFLVWLWQLEDVIFIFGYLNE